MQGDDRLAGSGAAGHLGRSLEVPLRETALFWVEEETPGVEPVTQGFEDRVVFGLGLGDGTPGRPRPVPDIDLLALGTPGARDQAFHILRILAVAQGEQDVAGEFGEVVGEQPVQLIVRGDLPDGGQQ